MKVDSEKGHRSQVLAINWFEVTLPAFEFDIQAEMVPVGTKRGPKILGHRTVLKDQLLYHLSTEKLPSIPVYRIALSEQPTLISYAIEDGFARKMIAQGLEVQLRHVGGVGIREKHLSSEFQEIYSSWEGLGFRSYYGFGNGEQYRWGLILRYVTRHRFKINLEHSQLRSIAIGRRVVPFERKKQREANGANSPWSGVLVESRDPSSGLLITDEGTTHTIALRNWTLPCNPENITAFVRLTRGPSKVGKIATELQKEAMALNENGRINNNYARDQLKMVQEFLHQFELALFDLTLPDRPMVRLSAEPLIVSH